VDRFKEINEARKLLELDERATMDEIKSNYRRLLRRWHPDKCDGDVVQCKEMTKKIVDAYRIILAYCSQYRFSFAKEEVNNYLSGEEWWFERFGADPLWGKGGDSK
jgi:preprotein translocase subunit Sec63